MVALVAMRDIENVDSQRVHFGVFARNKIFTLGAQHLQGRLIDNVIEDEIALAAELLELIGRQCIVVLPPRGFLLIQLDCAEPQRRS